MVVTPTQDMVLCEVTNIDLLKRRKCNDFAKILLKRVFLKIRREWM